METFQTTICVLITLYWTARVAMFLADVIYEAQQPPGALRQTYDDD